MIIIFLLACAGEESSRESGGSDTEVTFTTITCIEDWDWQYTHEEDPSPVGIVRDVPTDAYWEAHSGWYTYGDNVGDGDSTTVDIVWDDLHEAVQDEAGVHVILPGGYHPPSTPPGEREDACVVDVYSGGS